MKYSNIISAIFNRDAATRCAVTQRVFQCVQTDERLCVRVSPRSTHAQGYRMVSELIRVRGCLRTITVLPAGRRKLKEAVDFEVRQMKTTHSRHHHHHHRFHSNEIYIFLLGERFRDDLPIRKQIIPLESGGRVGESGEGGRESVQDRKGEFGRFKLKLPLTGNVSLDAS